jgi:hypothetical protein
VTQERGGDPWHRGGCGRVGKELVPEPIVEIQRQGSLMDHIWDVICNVPKGPCITASVPSVVLWEGVETLRVGLTGRSSGP